MAPPTVLAFTDTETTGLDSRRHHVWEVAVIRRVDGVDTEYLWQVRPDLSTADPKALGIGRYEERFAVPDGWDAAQFDAHGRLLLKLMLPEFLFDLQDVLRDAVVVGSNPGFDVGFLGALLQAHQRRLPWHYRPVDVATLAAGWLYRKALEDADGRRDPDVFRKTDLRIGWPWKSYEVSEAAGVPRPAADTAHTALGDARWARDLFDRVVSPDMSHLAGAGEGQ